MAGVPRGLFTGLTRTDRSEIQNRYLEDTANGKVHYRQKNGLKCKLVGDCCFPAGDDESEERRPIGIWEQRSIRYLRRCKNATYTALPIEGKIPDHLADVNGQPKEMLFRLVKQMTKNDDIDEAFKRCDQLGRV